MLKLESYWRPLPLNSVPEEIQKFYKSETSCQGILISPQGMDILIHFRWTNHHWHQNGDKWVRTYQKVGR